MTKTPLGEGNIGPNPTDRAKAGTKRSLLVDAAGRPLALEIEGAKVPDPVLFGPTLEHIDDLSG